MAADDSLLHLEDADQEEEPIREFRYNVSVMNLLNFGGPNMMRCGDAVWKAGHVIDVGVTAVGPTTTTIGAICIQTTNPNHTPHSITITTTADFDNWTFLCSCKAGLGSRCKHIYAVLLHIHTEKKLEVSTCTQQPQKWGKLAKAAGGAILEPQRIRDMPEFAKNLPKEYYASENDLIKFINRNFPETRICISKEESIVLNLQTKKQTDCKWRYERQLRVTASDCYMLFTGYNNNADMDKRTVTYYKPKPQTKNMKIGHREEANALKAYQRVFPHRIILLGLVVHPKCPWLGCSPDGYCTESEIVVEVKTLINEKKRKF